jgi:hypothetical protein
MGLVSAFVKSGHLALGAFIPLSIAGCLSIDECRYAAIQFRRGLGPSASQIKAGVALIIGRRFARPPETLFSHFTIFCRGRHLTIPFVTGGSATELSATDAWHRAVVGDEILCALWGSKGESIDGEALQLPGDWASGSGVSTASR